ncbi:hypothetical protein [Oceanospirillum beijerinckii]|uniref:hypothetical protein n=1 Tax=Oceanospirillum beijerinckii TaxID=64976 RepID=UPI0004215959|nr:hypothetical protein [Oceanospirillum beijerinckii]
MGVREDLDDQAVGATVMEGEGAKSDKSAGSAKRLGPERKGKIPVIDQRLDTWARWRLANDDRGRIQTSSGSVLGALMAGGGEVIRGANPCAGSMPDDIFDTDRAVQRLDMKLRMVVEVQYLDGISTKQEKASKCGCAPMTFYRRLADAHQKILFLLKSPKNNQLGGV